MFELAKSVLSGEGGIMLTSGICVIIAVVVIFAAGIRIVPPTREA